MPRIRSTSGRHDLARVPDPAAGYPVLPRSANNRPATVVPVAVADAYDGRRRVRALARIDLLDRERREQRISEADYQIGREIETVFESMTRISGASQWFQTDRVDAATVAETANILELERAYKVNAFLAWLTRHVGRVDTRILWGILGQRHSFAAVATTMFGRSGPRAQHYAADRFRDALAALASVRAARGHLLR